MGIKQKLGLPGSAGGGGGGGLVFNKSPSGIKIRCNTSDIPKQVIAVLTETCGTM